jgi:hypothetical protein
VVATRFCGAEQDYRKDGGGWTGRLIILTEDEVDEKIHHRGVFRKRY